MCKGVPRALAFLVALLGGVAPAAAEPTVTVLVAAEGPARPGFFEALRIQLAGHAVVTRGETLAPGTTSERVEAAIAATEREGATIGVWIEGPVTTDRGRDDLVVHVVGKAQGRVVIEIVRMPAERTAARDDPAVDRGLALKVHALLGDLVASQGVLQAPVRVTDGGDATAEADATAETAEEDAGAAARWGARAEAGAVLALREPDIGAGMRVGVGARVAWTQLGVEVVARVDAWTPEAQAAASGRVKLFELAPGFELRADVPLDVFRIGAVVGAELRLIEADGTTAGGATGSAQAVVPSLLAGPSLAWPFAKRFDLRLVLVVSFPLREQHYALSGASVADTGPLRAGAALTLGFVLP